MSSFGTLGCDRRNCSYLRWIFLLLSQYVFVIPITGTPWYCRNAECSEPMSKGVAKYQYEPTEAARSHQYLPVPADAELTVFRRLAKPDIVDVEFGGKRGFIPNDAYETQINLMPQNAEYIVVQGTGVLSEQEINSRKLDNPGSPDLLKTAEQDSAKAVSDESADKKPSPAQPLTEPVTPQTPVPLSAQVEPQLTIADSLVEKPTEIISETVQVVPDGAPKDADKAASPAAVKASTTIPSGNAGDEPSSPIGSPSVNETPVKIDDSTVASFHSTEGVSHGLSDQHVDESQNVVQDAAADSSSLSGKTEPLVLEKSQNLSSGKPAEDARESIPAVTAPAQSSSNGLEMTIVSPLSTVIAESQPVEVQPAMALSSTEADRAAVTPALPVVTDSLDEMGKKMAEGLPKIESVPEIVSTPVEKRPEPTVVFQQADYRASLPGIYQNTGPPVVFSTKSLLPHRHNHDHHGHSHGTGHSHGPAHNHDDHKHDHNHDHNHSHSHDHEHDHSHDGHDHLHEDHQHDQKLVVVDQQKVEPALETKQSEDLSAEKLNDATSATSTELVDPAEKSVVSASPEFIPPEDATAAPVNYTQLVQDRLDGKLVSQFLIDRPDREPSEGIPNPPPYQDPETSTDAPQLPGLSGGALPSLEHHQAIDSNPRYNSRRLGGRSHHLLDSAHEHGDHIHGEDSAESAQIGHCHADGGEGSCEELGGLPETSGSAVILGDDGAVKNGTNAQWREYFGGAVGTMGHAWSMVVTEFDSLPGTFRLITLFVLLSLTAVSYLSAASDRNMRREQQRGFEEYDHRKEKELLTLREQVQVLLKQNQELVSGRAVPSAAVPPPLAAAPLSPRIGPCQECEVHCAHIKELTRLVTVKDGHLKDHRDTHATLLSKNNDVDTQLRLMQKERDDLKRQLEDFRLKFADAERRLNNTTTGKSDRRPSTHSDSEKQLSGRLQALEDENGQLRAKIQTLSQNHDAVDLYKSSNLQSERDEAVSNVRLLRQLLAEKEDEIRRIRTAEAAGNSSSSRELQEKTDDLRSAKKHIGRLQQDLSEVKRDFETQLQIRCQTFRSAADKAQRDGLMARHETNMVRQQLEDICRRTGEPLPAAVTPVQTLANGAMTPPGLMPSPPLLFAGLGFPAGPPPPTLEAFKQHVLMQQANSSGNSSPPELDRDRRRDKRTTVKKSHTADFSANGKNDLDDDARRRDRSYR